jgi:hypothetical protein
MSADSALAESRPQPFRWWFLPSWLGLDAPCVVLTWTWAVSRAAEVPLPVRPAAALFLVVWSIYLADRLLDVPRCRDWAHATGRLRFGRDWQGLFWMCLGCCALGILAILAGGLPADVLWRAAAVALGVALHFLVFVFSRGKLPGKELGVGLFFALGAYACLGGTIAMLPLFGSIALVVAYNCLVIAARDAESDLANDPGNASRWWKSMDRDLFLMGLACTLAAIVAVLFAAEKAYYLSIAAAFTALTALHGYAREFSPDANRALADFALFTPWVFIGLLRQ